MISDATISPSVTVYFDATRSKKVEFSAPNGYNNPCAEVAQLVEQRIENPRVLSSILSLGTTKQ